MIMNHTWATENGKISGNHRYFNSQIPFRKSNSQLSKYESFDGDEYLYEIRKCCENIFRFQLLSKHYATD